MDLFPQLLHGQAVMASPEGALTDAIEVLQAFFSGSETHKAAAICSEGEVARGAGRGWFTLPDRQVLEVGSGFRPANMDAATRLAANSVFKEMLGLAQQLLSSLSHEAGGTLPCTKQQLLDLISPDGQQHASILHINCYHAAAGSSVAAAACSSAAVVPVAGGCEAHVDRGLLTLIADTAGGLQVLSRDGRWTALRVDINEVAVLVGHTLSFATAGQLPAALHRVVVQPSPAAAAAAAVGGGGFSRLSLAFKLRAAPGAVLDASALTGTPSAALLPRYREPLTVQELMEPFDSSHESINDPAAAAAAAAAAGAGAAVGAGAAAAAAVAREGAANASVLQITIDTMSRKTYRVWAPRYGTAADLRHLLQALIGVPSNEMRLICNGNQLEPDMPLMHCPGWHTGSMSMHMIQRLKGD